MHCRFALEGMGSELLSHPMIPGFLMAFLTFNWLLGGPTEHSA